MTTADLHAMHAAAVNPHTSNFGAASTGFGAAPATGAFGAPAASSLSFGATQPQAQTSLFGTGAGTSTFNKPAATPAFGARLLDLDI